MFKKNRFKVFKYFSGIKILFIVSFFAVVLCDVECLNSEETNYSNNILNIRYNRYNPYKAVEKEVNNGSITYKATILVDKDTEDIDIVANNTKKYIDNDYELDNNDEDDVDTEQNENKVKVRVNKKNSNEESDVEVFDNQSKTRDVVKLQKKISRRKDIIAELNIGTSGFGLGAIFNYWLFGLRFSGAFLKLPINGLVKEYIDLVLHGYNIGLSFLFRPFQGAFHIDIGAFYYNHGIIGNYNLKLLSTEKTGLEDFYLNTTMVLGLKFRTGIVPYFGFGWNINVWNNLFINIDVGLFVTGKLQYKTLDFKVHKGGFSNENYKLTGLEEIISYDKVKSILGKAATDVLEKLVVWPVVKIGFGYRFNL